MRLSKTVLLGLVVACLSATQATAKIESPAPVALARLPAGTPVRMVSLTRVGTKLPPEEEWAEVSWGMTRLPSITVKRFLTVFDRDVMTAIFSREMTAAGFRVEDTRSNLFENEASSSDLTLGVDIKSLKGEFASPALGFGTRFKGKAAISIEWQLYSRLERRVVARIATRGGFILDKGSETAAADVLAAAFEQNVRALAASAEFRKFVIGSDPQVTPRDVEAGKSPIVIHSPAAPGPRPIAESVKSVVVVFAGEGHGSGFLVSPDGHVLTDQHVVGGAHYVKVRWSDGAEVLGEVIRSDRIRDVALVKVDAGGRQPLRLRQSPIQPGETVFAIGAPLDQEFQGTVTRGVVSANRTFDGLTYLQSDVTVNPGNSGGPLLDDQGAVVGLTESGVRPEGVPSGLNLFTPIGDALDRLNLQVH